MSPGSPKPAGERGDNAHEVRLFARSGVEAPRDMTTALQRELSAAIEGEVRFDPITRALYSTDASVYQIEPLGVVIPHTREDLIRIVRICSRFRCPITMRGGGTSQAGQAIGAGLVVSTRFSRSIRASAGRVSSQGSSSTN
jgi:FAD/FMN-containing dehydrogenase